MTTPTLSFKSGDSLLTMSSRNCVSWTGSLSKTFTAEANNVLAGVNATPYFYDPSLISDNKSSCTDVLWGNVNAIYFRNINRPSVVTKITDLLGIPVNNQNRLNTLSAGDSGIANSIYRNIFNPGVNGGKFYSISGMSFRSYSNTSGNIPCLANACQVIEIFYTLRNIFNPRDTIVQFVKYKNSPPGSAVPPTQFPFNSIIITQSTPADFLTQITWNYSGNFSGAFNGLGTVTDAKGKTIEMKGITSTNIGTIRKDPIVKVIYDQKCLKWSMTRYIDLGSGFVKSTLPKVDVNLVQKIRPISDILYSDYFEGTDSNKLVRYFEAINTSTGNVIAELYANIDISSSTPLISMWSYWRGELLAPGDFSDSSSKFINTGFDRTTNSSYINTDSKFIPDMPLRWGVIPDRNMLLSQYSADFTSNSLTNNFTKTVNDEFGINYFILCGEITENVNGFTTRTRTLNLFSPNCQDINLSICSNSSECLQFGLNICENGKCLQCTPSNSVACTSAQQCIENKCIARLVCPSGVDLDCSMQSPIFKVCNTEKKLCVQCNTSTDCEDGKICNILTNLCQNRDVSCNSNQECVSGKECKNGICVDVSTPSVSNSRLGVVVGVGVGVTMILILIIYILRKNLRK